MATKYQLIKFFKYPINITLGYTEILIWQTFFQCGISSIKISSRTGK